MTQQDMDVRIHSTLKQRFGFDSLRPGQLQVIRQLMAGQSAAAVFPTGGGKSLCYQLPALMLEGITLVVSPLIALMKDQIDALERRGIRAARLDSSLSAEEYRQIMSDLREGHLPLLYVAPERFNNERFRASLKGLPIALFAVDEAHCISEWGHNFRPDYLKLVGFAKEFGAQRILALTATATPAVLDDICSGFDIAENSAVRTGFHRPNLHLQTQLVSDSDRDAALIQVLRDNPAGPAIVYVTLQKTAERVAAHLAQAGLNARAYHAGMKNEDRQTIQEWFMGEGHSAPPVVVATIAFGMGVDKADIRSVIHYNLPKSLENYSQEIGRAGRDGKDSVCHTLACLDDLNVLENFIYGDSPDEDSLRDLVRLLFDHEDHLELNLNGLSTETDIRPLVLRTLLTYLELEGYLQAGTPFYADYRFKPLVSSAEILGRFEGERREFLARLFRQAVKSRIWFSLDVAQASQSMQVPRERILTALDWLGEQQLLEVKVAGVRHRYRVLRRPDSQSALATELHQRMVQREKAELGRVQQVLDLITLNGCQSNALAAHFGEQRETPCGQCSGCLQGGRPLPERVTMPIPTSLGNEVTALVQDKPELQSPRRLTRFLCGLSSPRISRNKLVSHPLFGRLEQVPFAQVLEWVGRL